MILPPDAIRELVPSIGADVTIEMIGPWADHPPPAGALLFYLTGGIEGRPATEQARVAIVVRRTVIWTARSAVVVAVRWTPRQGAVATITGLDHAHRAIGLLKLVQRGRPRGSGTWRSAEEFRAAVGTAIAGLVARGQRVTQPALADLAAQSGACILCIRHLSKGEQGESIYRGQGSIDFTAAARSVLLAGSDPADPARRALVHIKCNVAPLGQSIGYAIEGGRFLWTGASTLTAADLLVAEPDRESGAPQREEAVAFLREVLVNGPVPVDEVIRQAEQMGIAVKSMLKRARREVGVVATPVYRDGVRGVQQWLWRLPDGFRGLEDHRITSREGDPVNAPDIVEHPDRLNHAAGGTVPRDTPTDAAPDSGDEHAAPSAAPRCPTWWSLVRPQGQDDEPCHGWAVSGLRATSSTTTHGRKRGRSWRRCRWSSTSTERPCR